MPRATRPDTGYQPWHPEAGLTLAFLAAFGPRLTVATAIAAFLGVMIFSGGPVSMSASIVAALWVGGAYGVLAHLILRTLPLRAMNTIAEAARFAGLVGAATLIAACGFVGAFVTSGNVEAGDALRGVARYWLADLNGVLMLTPLLMNAEARKTAAQAWNKHRLELLMQIGVVGGVLWLILALPVEVQLRFLFLLFLPTIWIAVRWNWVGALAGALMIQLVLIAAVEADIHTPRFIDLQFLTLTLSLTALLLGAAVAERRRSEAELRERDSALARAMRFAVAGELASALAHELNQPITALVSYLNASQILAATPRRRVQPRPYADGSRRGS